MGAGVHSTKGMSSLFGLIVTGDCLIGRFVARSGVAFAAAAAANMLLRRDELEVGAMTIGFVVT